MDELSLCWKKQNQKNQLQHSSQSDISQIAYFHTAMVDWSEVMDARFHGK